MDWLCHVMDPEVRDGVGWLGRERSQAVRVEGLSHVALLKFKLLWGDCTEGMSELRVWFVI